MFRDWQLASTKVPKIIFCVVGGGTLRIYTKSKKSIRVLSGKQFSYMFGHRANVSDIFHIGLSGDSNI